MDMTTTTGTTGTAGTMGTVARIKAAASLLAAGALIAASAAVAQAGGGAGVPADIPLFQCYMIEDGVNAPFVLTLTDQFGTREHVRLAKSRLLCTPVVATVESGPDLTGVDFNAETGGHLSCYRLRAQDGTGRDPLVRITDPFGIQTVELEKERLLCAGAQKEILPPPPPPVHHRR
jgi:hypothetical protein